MPGAAPKMPYAYVLIAETATCYLFKRDDASETPWQRFVLELKRPSSRKRRFQIGWNGDRLAENSDIDAARVASATSVNWMELQLKTHFPRAVTATEIHCRELDVKFLVHFTQVDNLPSILSHGIHPRGKPRHNIEPAVNDSLRLDGHTDATSVSISFPNSRMFYKYRVAKLNSAWAILLLDKSILWTKTCAFCKHNAADARITGRTLQELCTPEAFLGMFAETPGLETRAQQRLKPYDPTDVQAEVLVFNIIPAKLIRAIIFESTTAMEKFAGRQSPNIKGLCKVSKMLFADRKYARQASDW